ncbi:MAG: glycoside hydrolase family 92 protein, partial [Prevotella conceptionensis]
MKKLSVLAFAFISASAGMAQRQPVDYVSTLVGTQSTFQLSTGNTYPATAMPWGMNFWTPQTGKMGDGWTYGYQANKIRGLKQTHQPSPWINDYGQFALMATTGKPIFDEEGRASWFSHKAETAKPYHYKVYLADYDITAEMVPTERACLMRFTFPKTDSANVIVDAFDKGSFVRLLPDKRTIVGYTTKNSGGVPDNFKNYFVVVFDRDFAAARLADGKKLLAADKQELQANHAGAIVTF